MLLLLLLLQTKDDASLEDCVLQAQEHHVPQSENIEFQNEQQSLDETTDDINEEVAANTNFEGIFVLRVFHFWFSMIILCFPFLILAVVIIIVLLRLLFAIQTIHIGDIIVTALAAIFLALMICPFLLQLCFRSTINNKE